jgi:hypothetical protein
VPFKKASEQKMWRCPRKGCQNKISLREGIYFLGSKLILEVILRITFLWVMRTPVGKAAKEMGISNKTTIDWYNFNRDVCARHFIDNPNKKGGPGIEVEIDESKFGRHKYNRGRWTEGHWVFGENKRITGSSFLVEVPKRDTATLIPIIEEYIYPGSTIYSDEWCAYSSIPTMHGYSHCTVNH